MTIDEALQEIDAVKTAAIGHCHITRHALRGYGRRLTHCLQACRSDLVRDAVYSAENAIRRVHGLIAEESLHE